MFLKILRVILFVITNIIAGLLVNGGVQLLFNLWASLRENTILYIIVGFVVFVLLWRFLMALVVLIFRLVARISPFNTPVIITAFLAQGGSALAGIIMLWVAAFSFPGFSIFTVLPLIIVTAIMSMVARCAIAGSACTIVERTDLSVCRPAFQTAVLLGARLLPKMFLKNTKGEPA